MSKRDLSSKDQNLKKKVMCAKQIKYLDIKF